MRPMSRYTLILLLIFSVSLSLTSCYNESDATPISIWFDNDEMPTAISSGMRLNIKATLLTGGDERIRSYSVSFDDGRREIELKTEELFGASNYSIDFYTEVPYVIDDKAECKIKIKVVGVSGFQSTISKTILVLGALKDNSTGFRLFASNSTENDGFNISDLSTTYKRSHVDSLDIYFCYNCTIDEWVPKCEGWKTDSKDIDFVRADNYDYAKATPSSLQSTYDSSVKVVEVPNISAGNIIIVGYRQKVWGVFNCMAYDSESKLYTFSYKLIE